MARQGARTREQKRAEYEQEKARRERRSMARKRIGIGVAAVIVAGAAIAFVVLQPPPPGIAFQSMGNLHLADPNQSHAPYNSSPPSSGPHFGTLANWGESSQPVQPEIFIHNLEDAGIVLAYDCPDGCADLTQGLRDILAANQNRRLLMTPYTGIVDPSGNTHKGAAVAWGRVFYFDTLDASTRKEIQTFISLYEGIDHHVASN